MLRDLVPGAQHVGDDPPEVGGVAREDVAARVERAEGQPHVGQRADQREGQHDQRGRHRAAHRGERRSRDTRRGARRRAPGLAPAGSPAASSGARWRTRRRRAPAILHGAAPASRSPAASSADRGSRGLRRSGSWRGWPSRPAPPSARRRAIPNAGAPPTTAALSSRCRMRVRAAWWRRSAGRRPRRPGRTSETRVPPAPSS